jgi:hypothetical protein
MPTSRGLVLNGVLIGRLHEGFPTSPGVLGLACLQHGGFWVHKTRQVGAVEVSLGGNATRAAVPALPQGLLLDRPAVAALRELRPPGAQLDHLPARLSSQAGEERNEHSRGRAVDGTTKGFLPGAIGNSFQVEGAPHGQHTLPGGGVEKRRLHAHQKSDLLLQGKLPRPASGMKPSTADNAAGLPDCSKVPSGQLAPPYDGLTQEHSTGVQELPTGSDGLPISGLS